MINIRAFRMHLSDNLNDLPVMVTNHGEVVGVVLTYRGWRELMDRIEGEEVEDS